MTIRWSLLGLLLLTAGSMVAGADARAAISLETGYHMKIRGAVDGDLAGYSVAGAGDVNGDGIPDVILGAMWADNAGGQDSGSAYVVFGTRTRTTVNLATLGSAGFKIQGPAGAPNPGANAGISVDGVGDMNGDGRDDVIVGAWMADSNGRSNSGSAYVVFGKASSTTVDLGALGSAGFSIDGATSGDSAGVSVAGAGDVNGDGRPEAIVGVDNDGPRDRAGAAYVVFGKASTTPVDLLTFGLPGVGHPGFRIDGAQTQDFAYTVSGAGDMNGDGLGDVIVGADGADNNARLGSGSAYVVFGKSSTDPVQLATFGSPVGNAGFRIDGAAAGDQTGNAVAGTGDVNGDGRPDVVVGAPETDVNGNGSGSAFVVFGSSSLATVDLAALGARGYRMNGAGGNYFAGESVGGAGDVNADGRPDTVVGAFGRDVWTGSAYAVNGRSTTSTIGLGALDMGGFTMDGSQQGDEAGSAVDGVGDMTGDGRSDVVVGADLWGTTPTNAPGSVYVVPGQ
ncbi:MAG: hypothetical protein ACJ767_00085 [Chloroflexota bacterium]